MISKFRIITICGSGRFLDKMHEIEEKLTLEENIVFMIGVNTKDVARTEQLAKYKPMLDEMHLRKIDLSDCIFVVNLGGYIGESTTKEIAYAIRCHKYVLYLENYNILINYDRKIILIKKTTYPFLSLDKLIFKESYYVSKTFSTHKDARNYAVELNKENDNIYSINREI